MRGLVTAWAMLVAASALTTGLAAWGQHAGGGAIWLAPVLLVLAMVKARLILSRYLELDRAPRILAGFTLATGLWFAVAMGLAVAA